MFLDDELLEMCKKCDADTPEKIQQLNVDVCTRCETYYKSLLHETATKKDIKSVLDRTFNLFDSFVRMALKSNDGKLKLLGEMFSKYTYKSQFLSNEDMRRIYYTL